MLSYLGHRLGVLARIATVLAAVVVCSQLAGFMNAYQQNLAGRVAEAERDVASITDRAREADLALYEYIEVFRTNDDRRIVGEGVAMRGKINRAALLGDAQRALERAGIARKPFVFAGAFDPEIAADAWGRYKPTLPVDKASLVYIAAGAGLTILLIEFGRAALHGLRHRPGDRPGDRPGNTNGPERPRDSRKPPARKPVKGRPLSPLFAGRRH